MRGRACVVDVSCRVSMYQRSRDWLLSDSMLGVVDMGRAAFPRWRRPVVYGHKVMARQS